jgi:hypothetical protein
MSGSKKFLTVFFTQPLNRHHPLIVSGIEHDHALRRTPGDANARHRRADQLALVGDQHDLVGFLDRE